MSLGDRIWFVVCVALMIAIGAMAGWAGGSYNARRICYADRLEAAIAKALTPQQVVEHKPVDVVAELRR